MSTEFACLLAWPILFVIHGNAGPVLAAVVRCVVVGESVEQTPLFLLLETWPQFLSHFHAPSTSTSFSGMVCRVIARWWACGPDARVSARPERGASSR